MPRARQLVTAALAPATALAAATALLTAGAGTAAAQPPSSTDMTCASANPLAWAPSFTWHIRASSGASRPPGGELEPALLLSGGNDLPNPPASLFPIPTTTPYGTQVQVDWHNETTGASGTSVSDEEMLKGKPGIPVNRTWTGVGTVAFTVTARTGGGWWWLNTQTAVCRGTISVLPD
ncbi:hypothetical protein [Nocardia carnea]|uniref:hypothetical protein n=1 Tax=Nocardia carnea TaxID=37328 RepID=UPI002455DEC1|nr:hypothetical protein [Nocardia carnea]